MYASFCAGLRGPSEASEASEAVFIMEVWVEVYWNFSESEQSRCFIGNTKMKEVIDQLKKAINFIKIAEPNSIEKSYNKNKAAR